MLSQQVLETASQAVFYFQFNTKDAVRYIVRNAMADTKTAGMALKEVMTGYKRKTKR